MDVRGYEPMEDSMALNIFTNVPSLNAQRHLETSSSSLNKSLERLSSGLRINSAADDAAGLALADRLRADVRIASQAIRNANDGISAISVGEKALGKVGEILTRLSELASQSATGLVSDTQRSAIQTEFTALVSEADRISVTTSFNGVNLLSGGTTVDLQVGLDGSSNSRISFTTIDGLNNMPTETKNSTAKASRSGSVSLAARWLSSDSLRIMPAKNAPSANETSNRIADDEKKTIEEMKKFGVQVLYPDPAPFREATKNVWKDFAPKIWGPGVYEQVEATK